MLTIETFSNGEFNNLDTFGFGCSICFELKQLTVMSGLLNLKCLYL